MGNGLFCRLKTILRKKKKKIEDPQPEKNEQPTPVPQRSTPFPKADISMRKVSSRLVIVHIDAC